MAENGITVAELAERLGVSKQTIRRFVKSELGVATKERQALQLDATQAAIVADHFSGKEQEKREKNEENDASYVATDMAEMMQKVATLQERVAGLERENALLRERLEQADRALEREQMQARGFWSRLGQRLLGAGKEE